MSIYSDMKHYHLWGLNCVWQTQLQLVCIKRLNHIMTRWLRKKDKKNLLTVLHQKILLLHPSQLTPSVKGSTMKLINSNTITLIMLHVCMGGRSEANRQQHSASWTHPKLINSNCSEVLCNINKCTYTHTKKQLSNVCAQAHTHTHRHTWTNACTLAYTRTH